jgi:hypothetical protein
MKFGDSDNVNTINEVINLELNSAMNTYIPKKIIRVRPRDKPWTLIGVFVVLVLLNF